LFDSDCWVILRLRKDLFLTTQAAPRNKKVRL
jgi:hypothetical protein